MRRRALLIAALAAATALLVWLLFVVLPQRYQSNPRATASAAAVNDGDPDAVSRKINARLFYVAEDGTSLTSVEREVPYAEDTVEQARSIIAAQVAAPEPPLLSAVPPGTALRALFVTDEGEAYVDFSPELVSAHPGGSMNEMLTIYTIVDALTVNLPAVSAVQILVNGREVDTLAGHVDLRRPLLKRTQ